VDWRGGLLEIGDKEEGSREEEEDGRRGCTVAQIGALIKDFRRIMDKRKTF
jgi:hypothetical protein